MRIAKLSSLGLVKNAPIVLIFDVRNRLTKTIAHVEYECNQSIFDLAQMFKPQELGQMEKTGPKFLLCSYLQPNLP